jgi:tRNA 2-thiouridine synthesizing protein A
MPVYKASRKIKELGSGDVLKIICTDRGSVRDFPAFCKQTGHELIHTEIGDNTQTFYIKKNGGSND